MDDIEYYVINHTADMVVQEFKRQKLLKVKPTTLEKTKGDIEEFKTGLLKLSDDGVPVEDKRQIAIQMTYIQKLIKKLKDYVREQDYIIFYEYNIQNQSLRSIAMNFGISESTVKRSLKRCMDQLSVFLYPDEFISEILY